MKFLRNLSIFSAYLFMVISCNGPTQNTGNKKATVYACDVENLNESGKKYIEKNNSGLLFGNPETQSSDVAFSGQKSAKLFPSQPYGLTTELNGVKPDDYLKITVWRKSADQNGVISVDGGEGFYYAGKQVVEEAKNGWQKVLAEYFVPPNFFAGKIKIYLWNNGQDTIYFDDLEIVHAKNKNYPEFADAKKIQIHVDERDLNKLGQRRFTAFETSVLVSFDEDYSSMVLFSDDEFLNGELRLKGDLVDHLQGQKWSFRIKLKKEFSWNNMLTFSIQNPATRYYLHEWMAHKIYDREDVLTTRYGFIPVHINGNSLGIYAWEEHFEKQLVESRDRREGPILRFDETLFWQRVLETKVSGRAWDIDYFAASKIVPFKEGRTASDSLLSLEFVQGQNLLLQFKNREKPVSEIFDVHKLARYYALMDLTQSYHGFVWHNQRYYYNPITCLLEPIAFDGYIETGVYKRIDEEVTGLLNPAKIENSAKEELMLFQVFADSLFNAKYIAALKEFSRQEYIETLISEHKSETDSLSALLNREFPFYHFSFDFLETQARFIRENIVAIAANLPKIGSAVKAVSDAKFRHGYTTEVNKNLVPFQVHAFYDRQKEQLEVLNFNNAQVKVLGAFMANQLPVSFESGNELASYMGITPPSIVLPIESEPLKILFSINNQMYEAPVSNWPRPEGETSRQRTLANASYRNLPFEDGCVVFDGSYTFENDVVIPANTKVVVKPGTKINFSNGAGFFSFSAVEMHGTTQKPIEITSDDRSANGFNVLQPGERSSLKHVHFSGLGSIRKGGWATPSAITFYEADVDFENCVFASNSNCDDALNTVRSDFNAQDCRFENTFADAFDSDFCTGKVLDCTFENIGNDAIDFSGSQVYISGCTMTGIGDKAISGGEHSTLRVDDCEITNANIGVASKDLSLVELNKISINDVSYGLVAFKKKPEYGPAKIIIDNLKLKNKVVFHQIELGSTLILNGKNIEGREKNLVLKLYQ